MNTMEFNKFCVLSEVDFNKMADIYVKTFEIMSYAHKQNPTAYMLSYKIEKGERVEIRFKRRYFVDAMHQADKRLSKKDIQLYLYAFRDLGWILANEGLCKYLRDEHGEKVAYVCYKLDAFLFCYAIVQKRRQLAQKYTK